MGYELNLAASHPVGPVQMFVSPEAIRATVAFLLKSAWFRVFHGS